MSREMNHERQSGEPVKWYSRFLRYLMLGPNRSFVAVYAEEKKGGAKPTAVPGSWNPYIKRWDWDGRAKRYDDAKNKEELSLWEKREAEIREKKFTVAEELLNKASQLAKHPHIPVTVPGPNGPTILEPPPWSYNDAAHLASTGADLADNALGKQKTVEVNVNNGRGEQKSIADYNWFKDFVDPPQEERKDGNATATPVHGHDLDKTGSEQSGN